MGTPEISDEAIGEEGFPAKVRAWTGRRSFRIGIVTAALAAIACFVLVPHLMVPPGSPGAHYAMGVRHANGKGTPRNLVAAFESFLKAAEGGHAEAQYELGRALFGGGAYVHGRGGMMPTSRYHRRSIEDEIVWRFGDIPEDRIRAREWFLRAAEQGHAGAQIHMGYLLRGGFLETADGPWNWGNLEQAMEWFERVAERGDPGSQVVLWNHYLERDADGRERDVEKGMKWLERAAEQGDGSSRHELRRRIAPKGRLWPF